MLSVFHAPALSHFLPPSTKKDFNCHQLLNLNMSRLKRIGLNSLAYEKELKELSLLIQQQRPAKNMVTARAGMSK